MQTKNKPEEVISKKGMGYPRKIPRTAVNEIFESIQGEGALMGYATLFVRFQGCQVGCVFCDTKKSWKTKDKHLILSVELLEKIYSQVDKNTWICFTGGEPLEQLKSLMWLVDKLHNNEYKKLSIETCGVIGYDKNNAAQFPDQKEVYDMYNDDVFFSLSPKLFGALGKRFNYEELKKIIKFWTSLIDLHFRYQFKFVASCDEDFEILALVHGDFEMDCNMFLQIEASKLNDKVFIAKCFDFAKKHHKYRMVIQQHKVLNMQ